MRTYLALWFIITQDEKINCFSPTSTFSSINLWNHFCLRAFWIPCPFLPSPHSQHLLVYHFCNSPRHRYLFPSWQQQASLLRQQVHRGAKSSGTSTYIPMFSWVRERGHSLQHSICVNKACGKPNHFPVFSWSPIPMPLPLAPKCKRLDFQLPCLCLRCPSSCCSSLLCCQHGRLEAAESSPQPNGWSLCPMTLGWNNSGKCFKPAPNPQVN